MGATARRFFRLGVPLVGILLAGFLSAATYLPISDGELAGRSAVIVRARVDSQAVQLERIGGREIIMTTVTFVRLDTLRGAMPASNFRVRLPGGRVGNRATWVPGTPEFTHGQEVILFLRPAGEAGDFFLAEFALGRFDVLADATGRRFAVRPAFSPSEDDYLSKRTGVPAAGAVAAPRPIRVAESFEKSLRAKPVRSGGPSSQVAYAVPRSDLTGPRNQVQPQWVNLGGTENGTNNLFRWFWDTGASPNGVITIVGTQSNLSDSSNGTPAVQNAITQWHGVASSDVRYSGPSAGGTVSIQLDAPQSFDGGAAFNTPLPCSAGGVLGLGGTQNASSNVQGGYTFKGDSPYFGIQTGIVTMRQLTGPPGCYDAATFTTAVLHETGHTLGLGHPDQGQSIHSTTTSADWANAVMHSVLPPSHPSTPQTDDIQAIQFYYGTGSPASTPTPTSPPQQTPTPTPTGQPPGFSRGHVTPLHFVTPRPNTNGRQ